VSLDAFATEILRGRLQAIVDEAGAALIRTAFSPIIREAKDFACAILTAEGRTVVQSAQSIPVFLGTMGQSAREILRRFPPSSLRPGDVVLTNDPWVGTGHLFDFTALSPIFVDDELAAFAGVVAHVPDVGGTAYAVGARDVFEEGLRIPPAKVVSSSGIDPLFVEIVRANVRVPDQVLGDLSAVLNSAAVIVARTSQICRETSTSTFQELCGSLEHRTEAFLRDEIGSMADGAHSSSVVGDGIDGKPFEIHVRVGVDGDTLSVDYDGSSPQVPAAINSCLAYTQAYTVYALKCVLAPRVPFNDGLLGPLKITAPEGSIVHSRFPAAGALRNLVGHFIPAVVFEALGALRGGPVIAECGAPRPILNLSGEHGGERFVIPVLAMGGFGARRDRDGPSCMAFPTNTESVPVEVIEATGPVRVEEKELISDSGGHGARRGGLGQRITIRALIDDVEVRVAAQRLEHGPRGVRGGGHGSPTRALLDTKPVERVDERIVLARGSTITIESPGGGGFGPAAERPRDLMEADIENGYVTERGAVEYDGDKAS
jgi:N-methylhydantoinase B